MLTDLQVGARLLVRYIPSKSRREEPANHIAAFSTKTARLSTSPPSGMSSTGRPPRRDSRPSFTVTHPPRSDFILFDNIKVRKDNISLEIPRPCFLMCTNGHRPHLETPSRTIIAGFWFGDSFLDGAEHHAANNLSEALEATSAWNSQSISDGEDVLARW